MTRMLLLGVRNVLNDVTIVLSIPILFLVVADSCLLPLFVNGLTPANADYRPTTVYCIHLIYFTLVCYPHLFINFALMLLQINK